MFAGGVHGVPNRMAPFALASCAEGSCVDHLLGSGSMRMRMMDRPIWPGPVPNAASTWALVSSAAQPAPLKPPKPRTVWYVVAGLMATVCADAPAAKADNMTIADATRRVMREKAWGMNVSVVRVDCRAGAARSSLRVLLLLRTRAGITGGQDERRPCPNGGTGSP